MIIYLIKSTLCLLCLLVFYKFALENENMHRFKRFYLLGSIFVAFSLPLFTFTYYSEAVPQPSAIAATGEFFEIEKIPVQKENPEIFDFKNYIPHILWMLYAMGVSVFGFRFLRNLYEMRCKIRKNSKIRFKNHVKVLLAEGIAPHSFLKYIFVEEFAYKQKKIAPEIIAHEKAHVKQKHSWDILFVELLQVVFWFNPLFLILKKQIRVNHEFLADEKVISNNTEPLRYSKLLFNYSAGNDHSALSSPFNHLLIKKRIVMISKPFSKQRFFSRLGLLIPVLAGCIFFFNNKIVAKPISNASEEMHMLQQDNGISISVQQENIFLNGKKVTLAEFANELDKITNGKSDAELRSMNFNLVTSNPEKNLIRKLNEEYKKTRFASVKGNDFLPPAPPKAPKAPKTTSVSPVPSVPPAPESEEVPKAPEPLENEENTGTLILVEKIEMRKAEREKMQKERRAEAEERIQARREEAQLRIQEMQNRVERMEERQQQLEERKQEMEERRLENQERIEQVEERREHRRETMYFIENEKIPGASNKTKKRISMGFVASKELIDDYNNKNIPFFFNGTQITYEEALAKEAGTDSLFIKLVEDEEGKKTAHLYKTFKITTEKE